MLLVVALILSAAMLLVIYYDMVRFIIPNWLNGLLLVSYPLWVVLSPTPIDWLSGLSMFGILFAVGYVLFALNAMGGGDVKLLAICGLFTGLSEAGVALVVYMALLGGVLSILLIAIRYTLPMVWMRLCPTRNTPKLLTMGEPIPYGIAIAGGFLAVIWSGQLPGLTAIY